MTLEYLLTEADYLRFSVRLNVLSPALRQRRIFSRWIVAIMYGAIALLFFTASRDLLDRIFGIPFLLFAAGWAIFYNRYLTRRAERTIRRMLRDGTMGDLTGRKRLIIAESSVILEGNTEKTEYTGLFLDRIVEDDGYLYGYTNAVSAIIVPRTAVEAVTTVAEFRDALAPHLRKGFPG